MVGRQTRWVSFRVFTDTKTETLQSVVTDGTAKEATIFTDENRSYLWLEREEESRTRKAIDHDLAWTEDRNSDGRREVHACALRGNLDEPTEPTEAFSRRMRRPPHLSRYVAMFELALGRDRVGPEILQVHVWRVASPQT